MWSSEAFCCIIVYFLMFLLFLSIFVDLSSLFWGSLHMKINAGVLPCVIFNVEYFLEVSVCGVKKYFVVLLCISHIFVYFVDLLSLFLGSLHMKINAEVLHWVIYNF